jgi:hypothetical protein
MPEYLNCRQNSPDGSWKNPGRKKKIWHYTITGAFVYSKSKGLCQRVMLPSAWGK